MGIEKIAFAGPWIGEFGWEIMTWVPWLRKVSAVYDKIYICTFTGMEALYTDFHCEVVFLSHSRDFRTDDWVKKEWGEYLPLGMPDIDEHIKPIKRYKVDGEYVRYGSPTIRGNPVLFHARGIKQAGFKNWPIAKWEALAKAFPAATTIGTLDDYDVMQVHDFRGLRLPDLMDLIASANVVIGQSSGLMHLAVMCGTPVVVWGDNKTHFHETLEKRYKETWNPFGTPVTWIPCDNWNPEPDQVLDALKPKNVPDIQVLSMLHEAVASNQYIVAVAHVGERDGKEAVITSSKSIAFPDHHLDQAGKQLASEVSKSISKARAERRPVSWA